MLEKNLRRPVILMIQGSHLFGTNNEISDVDYRGVFLPSMEDIILGDIPETETPNYDNADTVLYSLHKFVSMAMESNMTALEMLYTPRELWMIEDYGAFEIWDSLVQEREAFLTNKIYNTVIRIKNYCSQYNPNTSVGPVLRELITMLEMNKRSPISTQPVKRLTDVWGLIKETRPLLIKHEDTEPKEIEVMGKKLQATVTIEYAIANLIRMYTRYKNRMRRLLKNEGVNWKELSNIYRSAVQLCQLYMTGELKFPFEPDEALGISSIKSGSLSIQVLLSTLNTMVRKLELLSKSTKLPMNVIDEEYWKNFVYTSVEEYVIKDSLKSEDEEE